MFDRMGDVSIGLVFGIVLMLLFNNLWGLGVGVMLGLVFLVAPRSTNRRTKKYMPQIH
ncbi:hypothetical protein [Exiguobacterium sp. SH0S1]|uniref:hypothetical protein n=1 Tax=Exiguobacterium sp. SH0S1 TaxID=2510949 RepID=UPI00191C1148|nr:hypothetical protein [Exiguobacterium sp. SH0S1]